MGGGGSQTIKNEMNIKSTTELLTSTILKTENSTQANCNTAQNLSVKIGHVVGCPSYFGQTASCDVQSSSSDISKQISQSANKIAEDMKTKAGAALDNASQAGNFQFGDKSNVETKINKEIETIIKDEFSEEKINETMAGAVMIQDGELQVGFYDCTLGGNINFEQDVSAKVAAGAVMNKVLERIVESDVTKEITTEIDSKNTKKAGGAAEVVDSVGDAAAGVIGAYMGPAKYAMVASVICCCLIVVAAIIMGMSPAGQKKVGNANLGKMGAGIMKLAKK
tara:strand:- start:1052 stop:1891 length:840 start_codon:yes stop_codon:yes gene_type:complete